ncbi:MAG TPA: ABC transporter ATP-binding protein [Gemmatimonadales bacterium]|nr:ABC transporter ATP-binding protein [Gemmatimonadales bacterium]
MATDRTAPPAGNAIVGGSRVPAYLSLEGLTKRFGDVLAVDGLSFGMARGEILALLGPSGSGKTTTLRLLAGFERADAGRIVVDGVDLTRSDPVARRFGMVFQHYALFPHLDVGENVAFGLESLGVHGEELRKRVAAALAMVDLTGFERRRVTELSGGQQQRVALARALAPEPRVLLLDEPLSNLDPALRERTRRELRKLIRRVGITTVIVTHEQEEAFDLADRVALLRDGRLEQLGTPAELYDAPATAFVARFVGRSSAVSGLVVANDQGAIRVRVEELEWAGRGAAREGWVPRPGDPVQVIFRPEALWLTDPASGILQGTVVDRRFRGDGTIVTVRTDGGALLEVAAQHGAAEEGQRVGIAPSRRGRRGVHLFPGPVS